MWLWRFFKLSFSPDYACFPLQDKRKENYYFCSFCLFCPPEDEQEQSQERAAASEMICDLWHNISSSWYVCLIKVSVMTTRSTRTTTARTIVLQDFFCCSSQTTSNRIQRNFLTFFKNVLANVNSDNLKLTQSWGGVSLVGECHSWKTFSSSNVYLTRGFPLNNHQIRHLKNNWIPITHCKS